MPADAVKRELPVLYEALARDIAAIAPVCEVSGRCCRFREYGHTLFLSRPEAELLFEAGLPAETVIDEGACPWQVGGLCTARDKRPMGCRIYFCDPTYAESSGELSERYIGKLKRAHDESFTPWEYRPLHHFLRESFRDEAKMADGTPGGR